MNLNESIAARWETLARLDGWQSAADDVTGELVVFNEDYGQHYTGADAWRLAALYDTVSP